MRWALNIVEVVWRVMSARGLVLIVEYSVVRNFWRVVSWVGLTIEWVWWVDMVGGGGGEEVDFLVLRLGGGVVAGKKSRVVVIRVVDACYSFE